MMLVAFFTVVTNITALEFQETTDQIEEGLESCTDPGIARIAGGEPANHSSWPWLVRLAIDDSRFGTLTCGGTIVSNKYVLTAGHCLFFATKVVATFADGSIAENEDDEFSLESTTFHIHPDYVGLNRGTRTLGTEACWTAGWGELSYAGKTPDELHSVGLNIFSKYYCYRYSYPMPFYEDDICAGAPDKNGNGLTDAGTDTCKGDSGGPLICNVDGKATMVGLTSRGVGCAFEGSDQKSIIIIISDISDRFEGYPGLYTSIFENSDWLSSMLGSSSFKENQNSETSRFSCALNKTLNFFGNCVDPENNLKEWRTNWTECKDGQRSRKYRLFSSTPKAANSAATHFDLINGAVLAVKESCNNPNVQCREENAVYDNSTKTCEPKDGFKRTSFGILQQSVAELGEDIISEVTKRINTLFWVVARSDLAKFDRLSKTLKDAEDDMMKKVKRGCGKISQRLNPRLYEELKIMHNTLQNDIKPSSSNIDALRKAIKLLNRYQQNTIFNCPKSGYGPDPTDEEDSGGVICIEGKPSAGGNMNLYHKCKIMLRMKNIFEQTLLVQF